MKATRQIVKQVAARHGATVTEGGERFVTLEVELPAFKTWDATGGHVLSTGGYHKLGTDCYADLLERMACGASDAPDCDCDVCKDARGEP